jgi:polyhydroxybutyrate depolymerase
MLHEPGEYEGLNVFDEVEQPYWVVVPETYQDVGPAPVYLWLAPGGGDHDAMLEGWRPYLDDLDGLMVMVNMVGGGSRQDVLLSLIDQMSDDYCVEASRIHVMGSSSSSLEADRMACEAADRIASFTAMGTHVRREECAPTRPVPLWTFTGDPDRYAVTALVDKWVAINGCDPDAVVEDLGSGVSRKTYQNCEADVVFYDIEGMGHVWPVHELKAPGGTYAAEYEEVDYLEETLRFFAEHPLP